MIPESPRPSNIRPGTKLCVSGSVLKLMWSWQKSVGSVERCLLTGQYLEEAFRVQSPPAQHNDSTNRVLWHLITKKKSWWRRSTTDSWMYNTIQILLIVFSYHSEKWNPRHATTCLVQRQAFKLLECIETVDTSYEILRDNHVT